MLQLGSARVDDLWIDDLLIDDDKGTVFELLNLRV
jgi:hypothetical protein